MSSLCEISGSKEQVKWAEVIRERFMSVVYDVANEANTDITARLDDFIKAEERREATYWIKYRREFFYNTNWLRKIMVALLTEEEYSNEQKIYSAVTES